jgi:hypothetical protein
MYNNMCLIDIPLSERFEKRIHRDGKNWKGLILFPVLKRHLGF